MRVQNQFLISKFAFLKLVFNIKGMTRVELHKGLHYDCILLLSKYHIQLMYVKKNIRCMQSLENNFHQIFVCEF